MASFQGNDENRWVIYIDTTMIREVRKELDIDLLEVVGGDMVEKLSTDPCLLVDVLSVLCQKQIIKEELDEEGFARILVGDVIEDATTALLEALADFFPKARGNVIRTGLKMSRESMKRMEAIQGPKMEEMMEREMRKLEENLLRTLDGAGDESLNSQVLSE